VTVTNEHIQALIAEIDAVLSKASPSLPWVMSAVAIEQRQVLERARSCLSTLQTQLSQSALAGIGNLTLDEGSRGLTQFGSSENLGLGFQVSQQASQQIVQAVTQELGSLRASLSQAFQGDLEELRRERSTLLAEIKQLEMQRQQYLQAGNSAPTLPPEFWHQLSEQLQYHVGQQIAYHLANLPAASAMSLGSGQPVVGSLSGTGSSGLSDPEMARLQALQARVDHLLMNLDSTLSVVFESLQRNLQAYQESLGQGMDRMYDLGRQGEMMFAAWIKLLVDRWGREPAAYRQSALEAGDWQAASTLTPEAEQILAQYGLGRSAEASRTGARRAPGQFDLPGGSYDRATSSLESLDLDDLDLSDLNLNPLSAARPASGTIAPASKPPKAGESRSRPTSLDSTSRAGSSLVPDPMLLPSGLDLELDGMTGEGVAIEDDLDAAMAFLDELSTALQDQSESLGTQGTAPPTAGDEILALLDETEDSAAQEAELDREVDDFYSSLFGPEGSPEGRLGAPTVQEPAAKLAKDTLAGPSPLADDSRIDSEAQGLDEQTGVARSQSASAMGTRSPADEAPGTGEIFELDLPESFSDEAQIEANGDSIWLTLSQERTDSDTNDAMAAALIGLEDNRLMDLAAAMAESADDRPEADWPAGDRPEEVESQSAQSEPSEPETDLFAPFADLLDSSSEASSSNPTEAGDRLQLEQFLFEEMPAPEASAPQGFAFSDPTLEREATGMTWDDLGADLGREAPAEPSAIASNVSQAEPSADLADLVELLSVPSDGSNAAPTGTPGGIGAQRFEDQAPALEPLPRSEVEFTEEDFVAADPDETLLTGTADESTERATLAEISQWLSDGNFRQQLRDDLVNLESELGASPLPRDRMQADEVFAEFGEAIAEPQQPDLPAMPPGLDLNRLQQALTSRRHNPSGEVVMGQLRDWFSNVADVPGAETDAPTAPVDRLEDPNFDLDEREDTASVDMFEDLAHDLLDPTAPVEPQSDQSEIEELIHDVSLPSQERSVEETILDMFADFEISQDFPESGQKKKLLSPENLPPDAVLGSSTPASQEWYLGIDLGTTGLSAVLYQCSTQKAFPICWLTSSLALGAEQTAEREEHLRLAVAALAPIAGGRDFSGQLRGMSGFRISSWGAAAIAQGLAINTPSGLPSSEGALLLMNLKSWLKAGLPYQPDKSEAWQPIVQWSDSRPLSLKEICQTVQALLGTLTADQVGVGISAIGLAPAQLTEALQRLDGVVLSCPPSWSETYNLNLRAAVLATGLVRFPSQIFCVDNTIAALLPELAASTRQGFLSLNQATLGSEFVPETITGQIRGSTLVISAGALTSELAVAVLPEDLQEISYEDFSQCSLPYGGQGLEQDMIIQVIWPAWQRQWVDGQEAASGRSVPTLIIDPNPQISAADAWRSLQLDAQVLPVAAEPAAPARLQLQQRLMASRFGMCLQAVARALKSLLQQQSQVCLQYADQTWVVTRRQLEHNVLLPYIQRLNRELNLLLKQAEVAPQTINQVICTGGSASFPAIARWLRQKLSNATVIQDTYPAPTWANGAQLATQLALQGCSRLAYGLALLPRYPKLLNQPRHQFNDYVLLWAMLDLALDPAGDFGTNGQSLSDLLNALQRRGFDPQACRLRVQALLAGRLPAGLTRTQEHGPLFTDEFSDPISQDQSLFRQSADRYWPDLAVCDQLRRRLQASAAEIQRLIESPLLLPLGVPSLTVPS